jgi:hypothetical protein
MTCNDVSHDQERVPALLCHPKRIDEEPSHKKLRVANETLKAKI